MFHVACFSPGRWVGALGHKTPMLTLKLLLPCPFPLSCPLVTAASAHGDPLVHRAPAQLRALCDFLTSHRPQTRDFLSSCHMFLAQMDCFNLILMTKPGFSLCSRLTDKSSDNIQLSRVGHAVNSPAQVALSSSLQVAVAPSPFPEATLCPAVESHSQDSLSAVHPLSNPHPVCL